MARAEVYFAAADALARLDPAQSSDRRTAAFLVPGRIEFLGKHTDYAGGRSLLCTVDRGFAIVASPRTDRLIRVVGSKESNPITFGLDSNLIATPGHWSNYAMTVARRLARNFPGDLVGADIAFASDLPPSSGMSSSSALLTAFFLVLAKLNRLSQRPEYQKNIGSAEDLAGYLATIENGQTFRELAGDLGVGTFGGSEDHTAILCAKPGKLSQYAFCPVRWERDVPLPQGYLLAVAASGVVAEKTGEARNDYNALSLAVLTIRDRWNKHTRNADPSLADVVARGNKALNQLRKILREHESADSSKRLIDRLEQFVAESSRLIPSAANALAAGRIDELGHLVETSQDLAERLLHNQVPETSFLAKSAKDHGAAAASAFGAGFGGSVWALVPADDSEQFLSNWRSQYISKFPARAPASTFFLTAGGHPALDVSGDVVSSAADQILGSF
jgi:galactokinase